LALLDIVCDELTEDQITGILKANDGFIDEILAGEAS
jgi:hypothetical protein